MTIASMRIKSKSWCSFVFLPLALLGCGQYDRFSGGDESGSQNAVGDSTGTAVAGGTGSGMTTGGSTTGGAGGIGGTGGAGGTGGTSCPPWNDGNPCTIDTCVDGEQHNVPAADGTECDDGNPCTQNEVCQSNKCVPQASACHPWETCSAGVCTAECQGTTLAPPQLFDLGIRGGVTTIADLNGDGKLDVLLVQNVGDLGAGRVFVLLDNGQGSFDLVHSQAFDDAMGDMETADFNGDGYMDLVVFQYYDGASILLNQGNGTFGQPVTYDTDGLTWMGVVADFDGDGLVDIALTNDAGPEPDLTILRNLGTGAFAKTQFPMPWSSSRFHVTDMNADGRLDIIFGCASPEQQYIGVMFQDEAGNFNTTTIEVPQYFVTEVKSGDFNGDGWTDLATMTGGETNGLDTGRVTVWLNDGTGNLTKHFETPIGPLPYQLEVADLNSDGKPDLVVLEGWKGEMWIFLNQGNAQFKTDAKFSTPIGSFDVADLNGDNKVDVAGSYWSEASLLVLFNGCTP